jgi:hypothetical protein
MPRDRRIPGIEIRRRLLGFETVYLTRHAMIRMAQRRISLDEVCRTIGRPDATGLPTKPGRIRVRWEQTAQSAIDVVYEIQPTRVRVITTIRIDRLAPKGVPPKILRHKPVMRKPHGKRHRR